MNLPRPALATNTIQVAGEAIELRSLTASQALHLNDIEGEPAKAVWMIACGTGSTEEEAAAWMAEVSFELATDVLVAIVELSGLEGQVQVEGASRPLAARNAMNGSS